MNKTASNTYKTEIAGIAINIERGGPALWHLSAETADAKISCGPFKTRKAAIRYAIETLN